MKNKDMYRLINEEISDFDFLGLNKRMSEPDFLNSKEFQTQFVSDVINDLSNKDKFKYTYIYNSKEDTNSFTQEDIKIIDYDIDMIYVYNGKDVVLCILLNGDNITDLLNCDDFNLRIFHEDSGKIDFKWLIKNKPLCSKFIASLLKEVS